MFCFIFYVNERVVIIKIMVCQWRNKAPLKEHDIPHLSKKDLYHRIRSRDYVREFKFDAITASSVRRRDSDFIYN